MLLEQGSLGEVTFPDSVACGWSRVTGSHQWVWRSDVSVTSRPR